MSWLSTRLTNESIRDALILLLTAFVTGTFLSILPLYFLTQHEPKDLFSTADMMTVDYAPLWIMLTAVQFGPIILTATSRKFRRFRRHALAILVTPFVMAVIPQLDPGYYSSCYTRCARLSEAEVIDLAHAWIVKKGDSVASLLGAFTRLGDTVEDVKRAELVQLVDWRPGGGYSFSARYQTSRGGLFAVNIGPECAIEASLTSLAPPLGRLIYQKQ